MSNIESNKSKNGGLEDYNNISDGIFPHSTTPSIKLSLGWKEFEDSFKFLCSDKTRIVGGFDTKGPLPYQLALETRDDFYIYGCGGILISSRFGVTADHCIDNTKFLKDAIVWAGAYKDPTISSGGLVRHSYSCSTYLLAGT